MKPLINRNCVSKRKADEGAVKSVGKALGLSADTQKHLMELKSEKRK